MTTPAPQPAAPPVAAGAKIPRRRLWVLALTLLLIIVAFAWFRVGMLALPHVPSHLTLEESGLSQLEQMKQLNALIWSSAEPPTGQALLDSAVRVKRGIAAYHRGSVADALEEMRAGIRLQPNNLVLGNAYRMVVFELRRNFLRSARQQLTVPPKFPAELDRQPIVFFEELDKQHSSPETKLNLALAWVDEMLLFPALEIKAPSSVQAVDLLSNVLEKSNPNYVPALFARGLNHLHRPSRLVWPESNKAPRDAAVRDIGRCVAIGRRFSVGSARLQASLALCLGDAYVKAGKLDLARSWWQIAQNLCRQDDLQASIRRRYAWQNEEILDRLEEELDRGRNQLDHPMTDLALMWN